MAPVSSVARETLVTMETIGGFRLVRRLGAGTRAEVHLGRTLAVGEEVRTVAVKVFRPTTATASIDDEIEALARCSSRFLLRLEDLTTARDGRAALILGRVGAMSLAELCLRREWIGHGEAVTTLAPLADAVEELHRVGVTHGNLRLSTVCFDDSGAPVIIGFGRARVIGAVPQDDASPSVTPAALEASPGVRNDLDALRALARTVVESTPSTSDRSTLLEWLADDAIDPLTFCADLRDRLFEFAVPTAVRTADSVSPSALPPRTVSGSVDSQPDPPRSSRLFDLLHLPAWVEELVTGARVSAGAVRQRDRDPSASHAHPPPSSTSFSTLVERLRALIAQVRRPVWVAAGIVVGLLVIALTVVGIDDDGTADASYDGASAGPTLSARPLPSDQAGATSPEEAATQSDDMQREPDLTSAIEGADPVAAVTALALERNRCFEARSILCLDGVDQVSSAAMDADMHAIGSDDGTAAPDPGGGTRDSGTIPPDQPDLTTGVPELTEQLGGSAIVTVRFDEAAAPDAPIAVTVLVVFGESGWRIRDLVFE